MEKHVLGRDAEDCSKEISYFRDKRNIARVFHLGEVS